MSRLRIAVLLPLLIAAVVGPVSFTEAASVPQVIVEGERLALPVPPVLRQGTTFVPLRGVFEKIGAKVGWDQATKTVTASKEGIRFTYVIGEASALRNGEKVAIPVPGYIANGATMVPLRLIGEALGGKVQWDPQTATVSITLGTAAEALVEWGVNFRAAPDPEAKVYRMLAKGEHVRVLGEIGEDWLRVQAGDGDFGYISASPKYTDYVSPHAAERLLAYGETYLGTPYEFGASSNQTDTFDCSSFVQHVYREVLGIELPRVSYDQAESGVEIKLDELRKGDLMFFSARGLPIGHVAIYAGDGMMLHTYSKKYGVEYRKFDGSWKDRFVTARRVF